MSGSIVAGTVSRRPLTSVTSTVSGAAIAAAVTFAVWARSDVIETGESRAGGDPSSSPSRCSFRHRVRSEREIP